MSFLAASVAGLGDAVYCVASGVVAGLGLTPGFAANITSGAMLGATAMEFQHRHKWGSSKRFQQGKHIAAAGHAGDWLSPSTTGMQNQLP
jgi:hypothetical protein